MPSVEADGIGGLGENMRALLNSNFTPIKKAMAKLRADIDAVFVTRFDTWHNGAPVLRFPKAESLSPVVTCFIINAVSLLDEALILLLDNNYPGHPELKWLRNRIEWLDKRRTLNDAPRLKEIANLRNDYAHELGKYGNLGELQTILADIEKELHHVGVL